MSLLHALAARHTRHDDADPGWPDRDRVLASAPQPELPPDTALVLEGPPGLAFGAAVGLALAERILAARFGRSLVDHRTWLIAEPRDLVSGQAQEALHVASALMLGRLAVLVSMQHRDARLMARYTAAGWTVRCVGADDEPAADGALAAATRSQKPTLIVALGRAEPAQQSPGPSPGAETPSQAASRRGPSARRAWLKRLRRHAAREAFQNALAGHFPTGWHKAAHGQEAAAAQPGQSGSKALQSTDAVTRAAVARLAALLPDLSGLQAAQTVQASGTRPISWDGLDLAAAATILGMALHGGLLPVCWSSSLQAASAGPALIAAARHGGRLLLVVTDPTPRAPVPAGADTLVLAPADTAEAQDCLVMALRHVTGPSVLLLSPDPAPPLPSAMTRLCARGAYLLQAPALREVTLIGAGPALPQAIAVHRRLAEAGVPAALVSMPCRALFDAQDETYRAMVLDDAPRIIFGADGRLQDPSGMIFSEMAHAFPGAGGPAGLGQTGVVKSGVVETGVVDTGDHNADRIAAKIMRHLHRSPAKLEASSNLLESRGLLA